MKYRDDEFVLCILSEEFFFLTWHIIECHIMSCSDAPVSHIVSTSECDDAFGGDTSCEYSDMHKWKVMRSSSL